MVRKSQSSNICQKKFENLELIIEDPDQDHPMIVKEENCDQNPDLCQENPDPDQDHPIVKAENCDQNQDL